LILNITMSQTIKKPDNTTNNYGNSVIYTAGDDLARFEKSKRAELQRFKNTIDMMPIFALLKSDPPPVDGHLRMEALVADIQRQILFISSDDAKVELRKRHIMAETFIQDHLIMAVNEASRTGLNDFAPMIEAKQKLDFEGAFKAFRDYFQRGTLSGPTIIPHIIRAITTFDMREGQSVADFHQGFQKKLFALTSAGGVMTESDAASKFLINLTKPLCMEVARLGVERQPSTLDDALSLALKLEALLALHGNTGRALTSGLANALVDNNFEEQTAHFQAVKGSSALSNPGRGDRPPRRQEQPWAPRNGKQSQDERKSCPVCKALFHATQDRSIRYGNHSQEECVRVKSVQQHPGNGGDNKRPGQSGGQSYAQMVIGHSASCHDDNDTDDCARLDRNDVGLVLNVSEGTKSDVLLMDSGATHHIFRTSDDLAFDVQQGPALRLSMMAGQDVLAEKTVEHRVWGHGWHYPNAKFSLLSLGTLIERGWKVTFAAESGEWLVQRFGVTHHFRMQGNRLFAWVPSATTRTGAVSAMEGLESSPHSDKILQGKDTEILQYLQAHHDRRGHPSAEVLIEFLTFDDLIGQKKRYTATELRRVSKLMSCDSCSLANRTWKRNLHPPPAIVTSVKVGEVLHMDIVFAERYAFLLSRDECSGYTHFLQLRSKTTEDIIDMVTYIVNSYVPYGHHVKTVATDHEATFRSIESAMNGRGILMSYRAPGVHESFAERQARLLKQIARALIAQCLHRGLPVPYQTLPYLLSYAAHTINLLPHSFTEKRSPYSMVTGLKINDNDLQVGFGDVVIATVPKRTSTSSLDMRGEYGFVLDHLHDGGGKIKMLLLDAPDRPTIVTRHAYKIVQPNDEIKRLLDKWNCSSMSWVEAEDKVGDDDALKPTGVWWNATPTPVQPNADLTPVGTVIQPIEEIPEEPTSTEITADAAPPPLYSQGHAPPPPTESPPPDQVTYPVHAAAAAQPMVPSAPVQPRSATLTTRSGRVTNNPNYSLAYQTGGWGASQVAVGDDTLRGSALLQFAQLKEKDPEAAQQALHREFQQLDRLDTFEPVHASMIPSEDLRYNTVHSMVVGAVKHPEGVEKPVYKARVVARGNEQDLPSFTPTSSPTLPFYGLFTILAIAASRGLKVRTHDVVCAYPNAQLPGPPVYMWLAGPVARVAIQNRPEWKQYLAHDGRLLVRLKNALYGLKEAGLLWHKKLTEVLKKLGLQAVETEPNVFFKDRDFLLGKYVDDIIVAFKDPTKADAFMRGLLKEFPEGVKEHNDVLEFLGILIEQPRNDPSTYMVSQRKQLDKLFDIYPVPIGQRVVSTPSRVDLHVVDPTSPPGDQKLFAKKIGEIAHLVVTRPDIAVTVSILQSFTHDPTEQKMRDLDRLLAYLFATKDYGLVIAPTGPFVVDASADASYGTRCKGYSHGGSIVTVAGTPVFWSSKKISLVADSSTKAEIAQAHLTLDYLCSVRDFAAGLGYTLPPSRLMQDNQSAMTLCIDGHGKAVRIKPWQIRVSAIKEKLVSEDIVLEHQPTEKMAADGLTKCLPPSDFYKFRARMHVFDLRKIRLAGRSAIFSHGGVLGI